MPTHPICQHDTSLVQHPERTIQWHNYGALFTQGIHSKVQRNLLNTVIGIKSPYSKFWCIKLYFMFAGPFFFQVIHNLQTDESKAFTFVKKKSRTKCQIWMMMMMMMWCIQHLYYKTRDKELQILKYHLHLIILNIIVKMLSVQSAVHWLIIYQKFNYSYKHLQTLGWVQCLHLQGPKVYILFGLPTLNLEATSSYNLLVTICQLAWCHIPKSLTFWCRNYFF